jgi:hypothetical protein
MSSKRKKDYREVFQHIWDMLKVDGDSSVPKNKEVMQDFDIAAWQGAELAMPNVKLADVTFIFAKPNLGT